MGAQHVGYTQFAELASVDATDYNGVVTRLETILNAATPAQFHDGAAWYAQRHNELTVLARVVNLPVEIVAYACSALSSQTAWARNYAAICEHIGAYQDGQTETPHTQGFGTLFHSNDVKAWAILHAPNVETAYRLLGHGLKTLAFGPNLLEQTALPNGLPAVTIDSIMYQAATGTVLSRGIPAKAYKNISQAVQFLSRKYGYTAYQIQAIVWVVWRGSAV